MVAVPPTLQAQWVEQIRKVAGDTLTVAVATSGVEMHPLQLPDVVIVSFDYLKKRKF